MNFTSEKTIWALMGRGHLPCVLGKVFSTFKDFQLPFQQEMPVLEAGDKIFHVDEHADDMVRG